MARRGSHDLPVAGDNDKTPVSRRVRPTPSRAWNAGVARRKLLLDATLADEDYCYITTAGRVSGKPHTVEIWFGASGDTIYVLAGRRHGADFVKNAKKKPGVDVRIGEAMFTGRARVAGDAIEDALARRLLLDKYAPPRYDGDLSEWGRDALPFAIDLDTRG